ncbi:MAG TPA: peroxiredoxin [Thermoplasmata archaeon]|jgi:peroxiredoxin Q/BCP|nr:peroxiredoxin [Thermoplasmata archaeon]
MLVVGASAPDFSFHAPDGSTRSLSSYRGRRVVLYFFPKANTSGCTLETRGFAERYPRFQQLGVEVIGVSVDTSETQVAFAEKCGSRFPMVGDASKEIARAYGVLGLLGVAKRVTFLLDSELRVREVVEGMLPSPHLRAAETWASSRAPGTHGSG